MAMLIRLGGSRNRQDRSHQLDPTVPLEPRPTHTASPQTDREALCGWMLLKDTTMHPGAAFLFVLVGKFTIHLEDMITALVVTEMEDKKK